MTRTLLALVALLGLAAHAAAEDAPASPAKTDTAATLRGALRPTRIAWKQAAAAIAPGRTADEVLVTLADGTLLRHDLRAGETWRVKPEGDAASHAATTPQGAIVATATQLRHIAKDGSVLWETKRPIAYSVHGEQVLTVSKKGVLATLALADGKQVGSVRAGDRREVALASLHPSSGLAVLGVADG